MKKESYIARAIARDAQTARRMRRHKNPFKIKTFLIETEIKNNPYAYVRWGVDETNFALDRDWVCSYNCYYRPIRTFQEIRTKEGHRRDYKEEGLFRAKATDPPSSWVDRPCSIWKTMDSWKHHSKRKRQWK